MTPTFEVLRRDGVWGWMTVGYAWTREKALAIARPGDKICETGAGFWVVS